MSRRVLIDMTGVRHGRLVGIALSHRGPCGHAHWHFVCDCGTLVTVDASRVRSGNTTSCGCRHREISAARLTVHGHRAARRHDGTYRAWQAMKDGCNNPASPKFESAGQCGISICPDWLNDYERFLADMGRRPPGTTLERLDADRDYGKANCIWRATDTRATRALKGWERRRSSQRRAPTDDPGAATFLASVEIRSERRAAFGSERDGSLGQGNG
ncbi:MAG: hypothetical protein ACRYGP_11720 [Janthinobacterium lividum]